MSDSTSWRRLVLAVAFLLAGAGCEDSPVLSDPARIDISAPSRTLEVGDTARLTASIIEASGSPSTRKPLWETNAPSRATIDRNGVLTAHSDGKVFIRASVGDTSATLEMTIMRRPNPSGPTSSFLRFTSPPDDPMGRGQDGDFGIADSRWTGMVIGARSTVMVLYEGHGQHWFLQLAVPQPEVVGVGRYVSGALPARSRPAMEFRSPNGRCYDPTGEFVIHDIAIDHDDRLHRLHVSFRQNCRAGSGDLVGELALLDHPLR